MISIVVGNPQRIEAKICNNVIQTNILSATVRIAEGDPYTGDYTVIPSTATDQTLATRLKIMSDNLIVKKVPYSEASNLYGVTATIG